VQEREGHCHGESGDARNRNRRQDSDKFLNRAGLFPGFIGPWPACEPAPQQQ
jgi:hypothetical protein